MKVEENVYGKTAEAESVAEATTPAREAMDGGEKHSTALGKFKNVDALKKAYEALQAEFTRRSQRLKELERRSENFSKDKGTTGFESARSGAEKRREIASERKVEERAFQTFVEDLEKGKRPTRVFDESKTGDEKPTEKEVMAEGEMAQETKENVAQNVEQNAIQNELQNELQNEEQNEPIFIPPLQAEHAWERKGDLEEKGSVLPSEREAVSSVAESRGNSVSSEELYARVCRDENVRLRVIGEYLSSLHKAGAPLMTTGAGTFVTPPLKAKTIQEAGGLALQFFKKGKSE